MHKTSILIINTGGTIGMVKDPQSGALRPFEPDSIYTLMPVLRNFDFQLDTYTLPRLIDSSNATPEFWLHLARIIKKEYERYDGFVILHGTDTMAHSASMLSFLFENLGKPVIFTGSQLPLGIVRTDGRENFINAIEIAAAYDKGKPKVPEVSLYFENKLLRGNRTNKFNAENFNAFLSGNYPPLAEVGVHIRYNLDAIMSYPAGPLVVHDKLDQHIAILKLFPGISPQVVESILGIPGLTGVILETYGAGNAPTEQWFLDKLKSALSRGMVVLNVTQCKGGAVDMQRYETGVRLLDIGVTSGYDITTESAVCKMMFLSGCGFTGEELKRMLQKPLRGEMTVNG